jgi:hypothetical protein
LLVLMKNRSGSWNVTKLSLKPAKWAWIWF